MRLAIGGFIEVFKAFHVRAALMAAPAEKEGHLLFN